MATKIISCSFEPGSMGGFITICNGVKYSLESHYSKTVAVTREAFIAACKDRVLFNDILGVDIRQGWQNALADAILPYQTMQVEEFDPKIAAKVSSELDVKLRGEDAVKEDIEKVEKENAKLEKATKKAVKAKKEKPVNPEGEQGQPVPQPEEPTTEEVKDESRPVETTDNSSEDARGKSDSELPADDRGSESAD